MLKDMTQVQFIGTTPEELRANILSDIKAELETIKRGFQPKEPTEYLTRNEVRDLLKIDLTTVWNWTKKGKLKAYGIGARVYYKRHEIEAVLTPLN